MENKDAVNLLREIRCLLILISMFIALFAAGIYIRYDKAMIKIDKATESVLEEYNKNRIQIQDFIKEFDEKVVVMQRKNGKYVLNVQEEEEGK